LPDQERQIVTFVMRNELVTASELSAHTGLVEAALRAHLRKLVEEGYLVELTEDGETRYRPATSRRRGSSLSAELWQKIDAGEGTAPPAPPRRRRSQIPDDL
jgi:predicted ArsR family transcriptional regulator